LTKVNEGQTSLDSVPLSFEDVSNYRSEQKIYVCGNVLNSSTSTREIEQQYEGKRW
jgi:hypothetical protein